MSGQLCHRGVRKDNHCQIREISQKTHESLIGMVNTYNNPYFSLVCPTLFLTFSTELLCISLSILGKARALGLACSFFGTPASTWRKEIDTIRKYQIVDSV